MAKQQTMTQERRTAHGPSAYGWPNVFSPEDRGAAIEDVWPSLYIGADRVEEMRRKTKKLPWAQDALQRWIAEAEDVLQERPNFFMGHKPGGRSNLILDSGQHLLFDPYQHKRAWNPQTREWVELDDDMLTTWTTLQHERLRRMMVSLGFLWRLTGDERYARWVWKALASCGRDLYAPKNRIGKEGEAKIVYGGLYEGQSMLLLVQAWELVEGAPGATSSAEKAMRENVFNDTGEMLARWLKVMMPHNMACWGMAALAEVGRVLDRHDWVDHAIDYHQCGVKALIEAGFPLGDDGKPDGLWFEGSTFYNFYGTIPLISLVRRAREMGRLSAAAEKRFNSMYNGPLGVADSELRFVTLGDRMGPRTLRLAQYRHVYEYAAGQISPGKYARVLAKLYEQTGAARDSLAAVAWGPDELPRAIDPRKRKSEVLSAAKAATFRGQAAGEPVTCFFWSGGDEAGGQGHHHADKLSLSLHAGGTIVTSDLGLPYHSSFQADTISHNTLMVNEASQGTMKPLAFDADVADDVPWARGELRGENRDKARAGLWNVLKRRGCDVREGVMQGVRLARKVWFDSPFIVLLDEMKHKEMRRLGFIFHAYGPMRVDTTPAAKKPEQSRMPKLPTAGNWRFFTGRTTAARLGRVAADWRVRHGLFLRLVSSADAPFEATWGTTPANPTSETRGTIYLRSPGKRRRIATVLELHGGAPHAVGVMTKRGAVEVELADGERRRYE